MKQYILITFSLIFSFSIFSQKSTTRALTQFDKLVIIGNFPVEIFISDRSEAEVETFSDDANLENLSFTYAGKTLTIRYTGSFVKDIDLDLVLYYPDVIPTIEARRGAEIRIEDAGVIDSEADYAVDSGSKILVRNIKANLIKAKITKGGSIQLIGETKFFEPTISAGGTIAAANLKSTEVTASVSLGGEIICAPIEKLDAKVRSGGTISYSGKPKVKQSIKLGGTIEQL